MTTTKIQEDSAGIGIGITFEDDDGLPLDISTITSSTFRITGPDGVSVDYVGAILPPGTGGTTIYTSTLGTFPTKGTYKYQAKLVWPGGRVLWSKVNKIKVLGNLPGPTP